MYRSTFSAMETICLLLIIFNIQQSYGKSTSTIHQNDYINFGKSQPSNNLFLQKGNSFGHLNSRFKRQSPDPSLLTVVENPVLNETDQQRLVDYHNEMRRVEPDAANMLKVVWNEEFAQYARQWSTTCLTEFDWAGTPHGDFPPAENYYNQNAAMYSGERCYERAWTSIIQAWYNDEVAGYNHETSSCSIAECGHYTTMVTAKVLEIGCGHSYCDYDGTEYFFLVCNYGEITSVETTEVPPHFTPGSACSACPAGYTECDDGLCTDVINADDDITPFVTSCDELENSDNGSGNGDGGDSGSGNESGSGDGSGENDSGSGESGDDSGSGENESGRGDENGDDNGSGDGSGNESESQNGDSAAGAIRASLLYLCVTFVLKMLM